jgi:Fe-Mn family superoxide dismutase
MFTLPPLPYELNALTPVLDAETIEYHYHKHHQAYIDKLNTLVQGTEYETKSLEDIVKTAPTGPLFNNAAQALNHQLYWNQFQAVKEENKAE